MVRLKRKLKINRKKPKGFSLLEVMVSMSLFLIVLGGVYVMINHYSTSAQIENSRIRMQQEARYLTSHFAQELKDAGAVISVAGEIGFKEDESQLGSGKVVSFFSGLYPLNNDNSTGGFPDGVIIASGDPEAFTVLTESYDFGDNTLNVKSCEVGAHDPGATGKSYWEIAPWRKGQKGILLSQEGYYIFEVAETPSPTDTLLSIREAPIYYSGLLNTKNYADTSTPRGNTVDYPAGAPVIRLTNFSIYLFSVVKHPLYASDDRVIRQLLRVYDTQGDGDVLAQTSQAKMSIISEYVYDLQISYYAYTPGYFQNATPDTDPETNHFYYAGAGSSSDHSALLDDIRNRLLRRIHISIVTLTDDYAGSGEFDKKQLPALGDQQPYDLPDGKYSYRILYLDIEPSNFNSTFVIL